MTCDHFFGIVYPLKYKRFMTKRNTGISLVIIWCSSLFFFGIVILLITSIERLVDKKPDSFKLNDEISKKANYTNEPFVLLDELDSILQQTNETQSEQLSFDGESLLTAMINYKEPIKNEETLPLNNKSRVAKPKDETWCKGNLIAIDDIWLECCVIG